MLDCGAIDYGCDDGNSNHNNNTLFEHGPADLSVTLK